MSFQRYGCSCEYFEFRNSQQTRARWRQSFRQSLQSVVRQFERVSDGVRLTALGAPWMSTRTHILREYRAAEEWVEAARANRIGLVRVACWRSPHAVRRRPSTASRRHSGLRSQYSRSSRWVPGRAGRYLRHCSTASPLRPHRGQILQAARERRAAHVGLLRRSVRAGGPGC